MKNAFHCLLSIFLFLSLPLLLYLFLSLSIEMNSCGVHACDVCAYVCTCWVFWSRVFTFFPIVACVLCHNHNHLQHHRAHPIDIRRWNGNVRLHTQRNDLKLKSIVWKWKLTAFKTSSTECADRASFFCFFFSCFVSQHKQSKTHCRSIYFTHTNTASRVESICMCTANSHTYKMCGVS